MIYFTSDLHFGHELILTHCHRPFRDVEEMNGALVERYNAVVSSEDTVYILGDVAHGIPLPEVQGLLAAMKGHKILLVGNHDLPYDYDQPYLTEDGRTVQVFEEICETRTLKVGRHLLVLMHYPLLSWLNSRWGSIMLHGHIHAGPGYNRENQEKGLRRFDVGVDANNYAPVSLDEVMRMAKACRKEPDYDHMGNYLDAVMNPGR